MNAPPAKQPAGGGKSARTGSSPPPRGVLFAVACVIFAASSWVAFRQPGRADPLREPRVLSREWLFTPVEQNAILGRPVIVGGLRAITGRRTAGGGVELWAVGDGGMILRSPDGGASWERRAILPPPPPATPVTEYKNGADGDETVGGGRGGGAGSQNAPAPGDGAQKTKKVRTQRDMNVSSRGPAIDSIDAAQGLDLAAGWALAGALLAEPPPRPSVDTKANEVDRASNAGRQSNEPPPRGSSFNAQARPNSSGQAQARQQPPRQPPPRDRTRNGLRSISFSPDGRQGWVVGAGGMMAVSRDGGATWEQVLASGAADTATFSSVYCPGAEAMWAVGQGVVFVLPGEGVYATRSADLFGIHGTADVAYVAGTSAADVRSGGRPRFVWVTGTRAVHAVDAQHVWAVGDGGTVRASGGSDAAPDAWPTTSTGTIEDLLAVHFADASNGWAVGAHGAIVHTADGTHWGPQTSGVSDKLKGKDDALRGVWFADARRGWAVGDGGIVIATSDGGARWSRTTSGWRRSDPETVGGTVWGLDDKHRLTIAAGLGAERTVVEALDQPLQAFHFSSPTEGWAIEQGGRMRFTADGGRTWDAKAAYRWRPAPWYYAACFVCVLLLVPTLRRPEDRPRIPAAGEGPSIADRLLSDRPLEPGDRDRLKFNEIALGIANFLRNSRTKPPMTLAITGRWGSGKTSMMNLVKAELARFGVRPVWFNAWHHQTEESLLAALLQNIRAQAVPHWYDPSLDGLLYHLRLLWARWSRRWPAVILLLLGFGWSLGYFIEHPGQFTNSVTRITRFVERATDKFAPGGEKNETPHATADVTADARTSETPADERPAAHGAFLLLLTTFVTLVRTLWRGLKSFGADPGKLMASRSQHATVSNLSEQAGFRFRFAREFREVTRALSPRDMLILIDDLDRCRPENVLEVMEAVNFLVSSGDCFVILGMDADIVRRCIGLGFKVVAEEMAAQEELTARDESAAAGGQAAAVGGQSPDAVSAPEPLRATTSRGRAAAAAQAAAAEAASLRARDDFARRYLEKLVAIQIEVPKATPVQLTDVAAAAEDVTDRPGKWRKFARRAEPSARAAAVVLLVAGLFCGAIWLGHRQYAQSEVAVGRPGGGGTGPDLPGNSPQPPPIEAPRGYDPGQVHGELVDAPRPRSWAWVYVPACLLLLLGGVAASLRPNVVIPDTEQFTKAINLWSPLLFTGRMTTPRTVKRFINRVRYLAMRQRPPEPFRNALQRLGHLIRRSTDAFTAGTTAGTKNQATLPRYIREETLVALSAVRYHADRSLDDEGKLADAIKSLKKELAKEPDPQHEASRSPQQVELEKELAKLRAYVDELGDLHELRQALPRFLDISKGVSVN